MPTGSLEERDARPWQELAEKILREIPEGACTLVYNLAFEKGVLQDLAAFLPERRKGLFAVIDGLVDLMEPFRRREIYHWEMAGSYSLKNSLPVLVPELSYESLTISNGDMASEAYFTMGEIGDHEKEWEKPCVRPARESVMPIRNRHLHRRDPRELDERGARGIKLPKVLSFPIGTRLLLQETQNGFGGTS